MSPRRRVAARILLVAGLATTLATSMPETRLDAETSFPLSAAELAHVTLASSASVVDDADEFSLWFSLSGVPIDQVVRVVPDDPDMPMIELTVDAPERQYEGAIRQCSPGRACELGFTVERIAGQRAQVRVVADAIRYSGDDFAADAVFELRVDRR